MTMTIELMMVVWEGVCFDGDCCGVGVWGGGLSERERIAKEKSVLFSDE